MTAGVDKQAQAAAGVTCPYCLAALPKRPQRQSRCSACGNTIFVKTLPGTRKRVLATGEQAEAIEAARTAYYQQRAVEHTVRRYNLDLDSFRARRLAASGASDRDLIWGMLNESLQPLMVAGDLHGLKCRYYEMALVCAQEERPFRHLLELSQEMELRSFLRAEIQRVEVLSAGEGNACAACLRLHRKVFATNEALRSKPLPCLECTQVVIGNTPGFCRCCYLAVIE